MRRDVTEIVKEYEERIDRTLPAKVQKFRLRLEKDSKPVNIKPRPVPIHLQDEVSGKLRTLLSKGFIKRGKSGYSAPLSIQYKKSGEMRLCIDYRRLNAVTINESYATPSPDELFRALEGTWHSISVDTIGPCDMDDEGYKYLLVIVDDFTRFIIITPLRTGSADETIPELRHYFTIFGNPLILRSDGGGQFIAARTEEMLKERKITHKITIADNHEQNGRVERFNREIRKLQRIWNMSKEKNLREFSDYAMETLNRRYSSQFDAQPFYAMFLREAEVLGEDKNPLVEEIVEKEIEKTIIDEKISSHDDKKEFTAKEPEKFEKDEKILLRRKREGKKEQGKLLGPYLVVERITDHLYRVKPIKGGDSEDVPVRRMVKYISDPVVSVEEEILINGKDETEYVVEKIIKHRFGGKLPIKFFCWLK
ncbi:hypothetical protein ADUPG1_009131 [Aduncisulcus paluster]|uniref:Integrase catalytic domain-containing protein n=1 Tax=Aduncisulcus paluster TaxID=2918883 RepID=A0ABQ5KXE5_9EUKA|nr:hypothetical protein ADUPG1_009131 [Aduncisulcus paluster]